MKRLGMMLTRHASTLYKLTADSAQPRQRSIVTRPFPHQRVGSGNKARYNSSSSIPLLYPPPSSIPLLHPPPSSISLLHPPSSIPLPTSLIFYTSLSPVGFHLNTQPISKIPPWFDDLFTFLDWCHDKTPKSHLGVRLSPPKVPPTSEMHIHVCVHARYYIAIAGATSIRM